MPTKAHWWLAEPKQLRSEETTKITFRWHLRLVALEGFSVTIETLTMPTKVRNLSDFISSREIGKKTVNRTTRCCAPAS